VVSGGVGVRSGSSRGGSGSGSVRGGLGNGRGEAVVGKPLGKPVTTTFPSGGVGASAPLVAVFTLSEEEKLRRANPALVVLTHPELERWHRLAIRTAVGDYGLGVIFVPLYEEAEEEEGELPVLRPLDPMSMASFLLSFGEVSGGQKAKSWGTLDREMKLRIDVNADVEGKTAEIIGGVRDVMGIRDE